jgi:hypothetical protein
MPSKPTTAALRAEAERRAAAQRRGLVDEYGDLVATLAPLKNAIARKDEIAKTIRSWYAGEAASAAFTAAGDHYAALVGAKGNETRIDDLAAVYAALGHDRFLASCSLTLAALKAAGLDVAAFTSIEQTGSRSLTVTELPE